MYINAVEIVDKSEVAEGGFVFGRQLQHVANTLEDVLRNGFSRSSKGKVIDLTEEEYWLMVKIATVDGTIVGGVAETKVRRCKDSGDVLFPESAGFRMALEGMLHREDFGAIRGHTEPKGVPFCIGIINGNVRGTVRRGRMCVCIFGIAAVDAIAHFSSKGKE